MNVLVDSFGWIEYFGEGRLSEKYGQYIEKANKSEFFTPSIVLFEVYKQIKRMQNETKALEAIAYIVSYTTVIILDENIAIEAAEKSIETGLGMADSIIKATAEKTKAKIITSDKHFRGMKEIILVE
ncbi:MAG: type II toxin-antitoxin system VapC family toxin [Candidatus Diapherotrites archaeon]